MTTEQNLADALAETWIDREREKRREVDAMRNRGENWVVKEAHASHIAEMRRELQEHFGLVRN